MVKLFDFISSFESKSHSLDLSILIFNRLLCFILPCLYIMDLKLKDLEYEIDFNLNMMLIGFDISGLGVLNWFSGLEDSKWVLTYKFQ